MKAIAPRRTAAAQAADPGAAERRVFAFQDIEEGDHVLNPDRHEVVVRVKPFPEGSFLHGFGSLRPE